MYQLLKVKLVWMIYPIVIQSIQSENFQELKRKHDDVYPVFCDFKRTRYAKDIVNDRYDPILNAMELNVQTVLIPALMIDITL